MKTHLVYTLGRLFPVERHEWPKALMLLGVATLLGIGYSVSRTASEALFLTRFGVDFLPYLQLLTPFLVLVATTIYGVFAHRIPSARLLMYTALIPLPLIVLMRFLIVLNVSWIYFLLFAFVLAYASVLATSWAVYVPGHYDVQEAKRLLPFISSGILLGTVLGGVGMALCVPVIGAANALFIWMGVLLAMIALVQAIDKRFTPLNAAARKVTAAAQRSGHKKPDLLSNIQAGMAYSRSSALFLTTAVATIAMTMALQLIDFEYSKIFARKYPDSTDLAAFLGIVDGLTTIVALLLQWFVVPQFIRRLGVQGTNVLFPFTLTAACGGLLVAPVIGAGILARFTRYSLLPSLRDTTRTLILNAVPRKISAIVRSFNTGIVLPVGQAAGALVLVLLQGFTLPILFPLLGLLICAAYVFYTFKQNAAYGGALLELLREDKIHLLDLEDDEIRQLNAAAVAAISERLRTDQTMVSRVAMELSGEPGQVLQEIALAHEEVSLAAIELLRTIASPQAFAALQEHLPYASPQLTAAALQALATIDGEGTPAVLAPYLNDAQPQVRIAALNGLRHLKDATMRQRAEELLDDPDVRVRALAVAVVRADATGPASERALQLWEAMLDTDNKETLLAALSVFPSVADTSLQQRVYKALDHVDLDIRREALRVLHQLAAAGRMTALDAALLRTLQDDDVEIRQLALQVLTVIDTASALEHILLLLDDEQPSVREALIRSLQSFSKRAVQPLLGRLRSPQSSLLAKESALLALARLPGVQPDQLLPFWQAELHDIYQYKLMLTHLEESPPLEADAFLLLALSDAYERSLVLLMQLLAVWTTPEVARLVESGLHDTERQKRAQALEALESLSERRFTRLFLPILQEDGNRSERWREIARSQWELAFDDTPTLLAACIESSHKWIVIGGLLSAQAREARTASTGRLETVLETATDADVRRTAQQMLGLAVEEQYLSLTQALLFLKRIPLFSNLNLAQLRVLADYLVECEVLPGMEIFHEGDFSHDLYLIVSGKVDIVQQRGDTEHTIVTLEAGDFFGDMAVIEDCARSAGAVAAELSMLLRLSSEHCRQVVLLEPAISFEIFRQLSARLRRLEQEEAAAAQ